MIDVIYQDSERKEQAIAAAIENNTPCFALWRRLPPIYSVFTARAFVRSHCHLTPLQHRQDV